MFRNLRLVLAGALCFSSLPSRADILFLDVNNSPKEIQAAQKAAHARKEKLIVIPDPNKLSAPDKELRRKIEEASRNAQNVCTAVSGSQCTEAIEARNKLVAKQRNSDSYLNNESLNRQLAKLKKDGTQLSSLVISGHDGNGYFGGTQGTLDDKGISQAFANNAPLGDSIRSMMLWGCYTANIGSLTYHWKKALPNVEMIAGYDGIAPLGDKPANWDYLADILTKEKKLTAIKDANELQKSLKGLDGTNLLNASVCVGNNFASNKLALDLRDAEKLCAGALEAVKPVYDCYLKAETDKCSNPPKNTGDSELRTAYNKLQDSRHCVESADGRISTDPDTPSPDTLIRLIHFQNIKSNMVEQYPDFVSRYNELVAKSNLPKDLQWRDITKMSRQEILNKLNKSNDVLTDRLKMKTPDNPEVLAVKNGLYALQATLGDLAVPFGWVEPSAHDINPYITASIDNMSQDGIARGREFYERSRASDDIKQAMTSFISEKNPEYKSLADRQDVLEQQIKSTMTRLRKGTPEQRNENQKEYIKLSEEYKTVSSKTQDISKSELPKLEQRLKDQAKQLASQPYANKEGQKIYQDSLNEQISNYFGEPAL